MSSNKAKERVFWHEIGHFTAQYLNKQYFGKFGVKQVIIEKVNYDGLIEYTGGCTPIPPSGYTGREPIGHPASTLASLTYGCIFQSIFQESEFENCFAPEAPGVNGFDDFDRVDRIMKRFSLSEDEKLQLRKHIREQYEVVKATNQLQTLFKTQIHDLINSNELKIEIEVNELEKRFTTFLFNHAEIYKSYVSKLELIFGNHSDLNPYRLDK